MGKEGRSREPWVDTALTSQARDDDGPAQGGDSRGRISTECMFKVEPIELGASLLAQMVKNLPTMEETWVRSLRQEDAPTEGKGNPFQYSYLRNPMDRGTWWAPVHGGHKESNITAMSMLGGIKIVGQSSWKDRAAVHCQGKRWRDNIG